jgi:PAS domain S-box-containing protein
MQPSSPQDIEILQARVAELEKRVAEQAVELEKYAIAARGVDDGLLRAALESIAEGVVICDAKTRTMHFNAAALAMHGVHAPEMPPEQWPQAYGIHSADGGHLIPADELPLARALRGEPVEHFEACMRKDDDPARTWIEACARPIHASDGSLRGAVVVLRDITERRQHDEDLRMQLHAEAERIAAETQRLQQGGMLRLLLDNLDIVVWAVDEQGIFTFQEGRGLQAAGMRPGQLVGQSIIDLYQDPDIRRAMNGETVHTSGGSHGIFWESWYLPIQKDGDHVSGAMGLSLNVTETQRAKIELESKLALIERQQEVIRNLETPVIQVWDKVVTLPMVGVVDSLRAARVMDDLLASVTRTQAQFAILDLTGVDIVDTNTAAHLIQMIEAVRLLGAEGIITGIRPNVAQTMVTLGLDMSRVTTLATLRDGLSLCIRRLSSRKR